jgi:hypothetical protein
MGQRTSRVLRSPGIRNRMTVPLDTHKTNSLSVSQSTSMAWTYLTIPVVLLQSKREHKDQSRGRKNEKNSTQQLITDDENSKEWKDG